jgi:hypothetical protein
MPGKIKHRANISAPNVKVFPTCRGMLHTIPPTVAAYFPAAFFASTSLLASCCHGSNSIPSAASFCATAGQPVVTIPAGLTT